MTSSEAVSKISNVHSSFYIGLASIWLLSNKEVRDKYLTATAVLSNELSFDLNVINQMLSDEKVRSDFLSDFIMGIMRNVIKESFEITLEFAKQNNLVGDLKIQQWYPFARICRNCLSHSFKVEFRSLKDKQSLPVSWNGVTIDLTNENQPLDIKHFSLVKSRELIHEFKNFIKQNNVT